MDLKKCREYIDNLKKNSGNEIKWAPLRKFMIEDLGCDELPKTGGSHVPFSHWILRKYEGEPGHFRVALKKNKFIYRDVYRQYTYQVLDKIIKYLMEEGEGGAEKS